MVSKNIVPSYLSRVFPAPSCASTVTSKASLTMTSVGAVILKSFSSAVAWAQATTGMNCVTKKARSVRDERRRFIYDIFYPLDYLIYVRNTMLFAIKVLDEHMYVAFYIYRHRAISSDIISIDVLRLTFLQYW